MKEAVIEPKWSSKSIGFFSDPEVKNLLVSKFPAASLRLKQGKIVQRSWWGRLLCRRMKGQEAIDFRNRVSELVVQLKSCPELSQLNAERLSPELHSFVKQVQRLFFRRLAKLSPQLFDRSSILDNPGTHDSGSLKLLLAAKENPSRLSSYTNPLKDHYAAQKEMNRRTAIQERQVLDSSDLSLQEKIDIIADLHLFQDTHRLQVLRSEQELAQKLGLGATKAKGATGTELVLGPASLLAVQKYSTNNKSWLNRLKRIFGQLSHLSSRAKSQIDAEVYAYRVWQMAGLEDCGVQLPPSMILDNGKAPVLFMMSLFLQLKYQLERKGEDPGRISEIESKTKEANEAEVQNLIPSASNKAPHSYSEEELTRLQVFGGLDYYLFNFDRHGENWMVYTKSGFDESAQVDQIGCIDTANIMPLTHGAKGYIGLSRQNLLLQRNMQFAVEPLTSAAREHYRRLASQIESHITMALNELPGYLCSEMIALHRLRSRVMLAAIEDPDMTFAKLANISTTAEMQAYCSKG